jgi:hypothetical protein
VPLTNDTQHLAAFAIRWRCNSIMAFPADVFEPDLIVTANDGTDFVLVVEGKRIRRISPKPRANSSNGHALPCRTC